DPATAFQGGFLPAMARISMAYDPLVRAGAVGLLWPSRLSKNDLKAHFHYFKPSLVAPVPVIDVGADDVKDMLALLARGPVTIDGQATNRVAAPRPVHDVIAELRGRESPAEWVLVGAHLDSWDNAPGAQDDGAGVAMVLEAARAIAALPVRPRRS